MITVRYIFHSCFVVETDSALLVFDYWMDPADAIRRYVDASGGKHIYVFASHFHEDHFSKEIFRWREDNPFTDYTYILSKDILKHRRAKRDEADVWMAKGAAWHDENISVWATGSTDSGVSWIVEAGGKRIFHAGDLGNWYARFLADGLAAEGEIYSEEFGMMVNPLAEEKRYLGELKDIRKITDSFDIAMLPIDGRIGNGYTRGARQFIERFRVGLLIPMHFVMSGFESAWRMEPFCGEKGIPFWRIQGEGDEITI